ncbi:MAG: DNA-processing protein DprA, partial [Geobacter sp.]|nr:DNA-processing protein DprA [Geobacter sp.]
MTPPAMEIDAPYYWFALKSIPNVGNVTFRRLLEQFGSPSKVLAASHGELAAVEGVRAGIAAAVKSHNYHQEAEKGVAALERSGASIVTLLDEDYPQLLKEIPDPPPYFYLKGKLPPPATAIAVVGSRRASDYGLSTTKRLSQELAEQGIAIVSGLASGVAAT